MSFGTLEIRPLRGADPTISASVEYNAIATNGGELLFVSAIGSAADFKVISSVANSQGSIPAQWIAAGLKVLRPADSDKTWRYPHEPGRLSMSTLGYNIHKHRIGFGQEHRLFVSRSPGFMLVATDEAIWRELKSDSFTTPMVREWLPYVAGKLRSEGLLTECLVYPYKEPNEDEEPLSSPMLSCACITGTTDDIDKIVLNGLRNKEIFISTGGHSEKNQQCEVHQA